MKTLRITAALLLALTTAACTGSPAGPTLQEASGTAALSEGTGFFGGGTRAP